MLICYYVPVFHGFLVFTRSYEYFRKYNNRKDEIALVEHLYGSKPSKYKILKSTRADYYDIRIYPEGLAASALAKHVGAEKIESGKKIVGES